MKLVKMLALVATCASIAVASAQTVYYKGRAVNFRPDDRPYNSQGTFMVSGIALARETDVRYDQNSAGTKIDLYWKDNHVFYEVGKKDFFLNGRARSAGRGSEKRNDRFFLAFQMFEAVTDRAISTSSSWPGGGNGGNGGNWGGNGGSGGNGGNWGGNGGSNSNDNISIRYRGRTLNYSNNESPFVVDRTTLVAFARTGSQISEVRTERDRDRRIVRLYGNRHEVVYTEGSRSYRLDGRNRDLRARSEDRNNTFFVPIELFNAVLERDLEVKIGNGNWGGNGGSGGNWGGNGGSGGNWGGNGGNNGNWGGNGGNNGNWNDRNVSIRYRGRTLSYGSNEAPFVVDGTVMVAFNKTGNQISEVRTERDRDRRIVRLYGNRKEVSHFEGERSYRLDGRNREMRARSQDKNGTFYVPIDLYNAVLNSNLEVNYDRN